LGKEEEEEVVVEEEEKVPRKKEGQQGERWLEAFPAPKPTIMVMLTIETLLEDWQRDQTT
jgi:hypothetical protein